MKAAGVAGQAVCGRRRLAGESSRAACGWMATIRRMPRRPRCCCWPPRPDVMVVAAYGLILPAWVLALPDCGCLNVHASLLPRWRGAAPIHRAIEAGDRETGITIMQMDAGLDTGAMLRSGRVAIGPAATTASLHDELAVARRPPDGRDAAAAGRRRVAAGAAAARRGQLCRQDRQGGGGDRLDARGGGRSSGGFAPSIRFLVPARVIGGESCQVVARAGRAGAAGCLARCWLPGLRGCWSPAAKAALRIDELQRPGGRRQSAQAFLQSRPLQAGRRVGLSRQAIAWRSRDRLELGPAGRI